MKFITCLNLVISILLISSQISICQTIVKGKITSVDGSKIPKIVLSVSQDNPRDIFRADYEDLILDKDNSYQLILHDPGIYRITIRGVFHHTFNVPLLVYDQEEIEMNILLNPMYFNDGFYFSEDEYLEWIRVVGNFNDYDFESGSRFTLNTDGSISAFIPVVSDTLRYQVRGLTYGRGITPLPIADEYHVRDDQTIESVLYNDLPGDSVEIRYVPHQTIPVNRYIPDKEIPQRIMLQGYVAFKNESDQYWVKPLNWIQYFQIYMKVVDWNLSEGIPISVQKELQSTTTGNFFEIDLSGKIDEIMTLIDQPNLHPQKKSLLLLAYAELLHKKDHRSIYHQQFFETEVTEEISYDLDLINKIPQYISPVHPVWNRSIGLPDFILMQTEYDPVFINYFTQIVTYHPNEQAVRNISMSLIRALATGFNSIEDMEVYQIIVERFGERDIARSAHLVFNQIQSEKTN